MTVAEFYDRFLALTDELGVRIEIHGTPNEISDPIPFAKDTKHASYDADAVHRFWRALVQIDRVFKCFRTGFLGKSSPVHFFWGSFDLAVTRFSGRVAPLNPAIDAMMREAYSHEVSSCGFWPGDRRFPNAAFYAYAAPTPEGFSSQPVHPGEWNSNLGEFILKYDDVRGLEYPGTPILAFCQSPYEAPANVGHWDRSSLER